VSLDDWRHLAADNDTFKYIFETILAHPKIRQNQLHLTKN